MILLIEENDGVVSSPSTRPSSDVLEGDGLAVQAADVLQLPLIDLMCLMPKSSRRAGVMIDEC